MNFIEDLNINGHLQIAKIYEDGAEEIVFDDHNVIVSGMSVGLSYLFTLSGSAKVTDYQLSKFQLGVSGPRAGGEVSSTYELSGPLSSFDEYGGTDGGLLLVSSSQIKTSLNVATEQLFAVIPHSHVTRISDTSVRYTIVIDRYACNSIAREDGNMSLTEIGLFMKNPRGGIPEQSILVAYRNFSKITKSSDFALVFRWTINF